MTKDLYFWAQSLDNQAPDVIFKDGKELSDDESRQKLVSEIYEIPKSNIKVLRADAVTIRYNYSKFVIEAIPTQNDGVHRLAPIVIYGVLPKDFSEDWGVEKVHSEIEDFVSKKLNRTLDDSALIAIKNELSEILKNKNGRFAIQSFQSNPKVSLLLWAQLEAFMEQIYKIWKQAFKKNRG